MDLIIRNGTIVDGAGAPAFQGDVAIEGNRIVAVGVVEGTAAQEIDAQGLLVTPGWVDTHTHYDGQATWDSLLAPSSWHGVTTVIMGNCGVGFAPVRPGDHQFLIDLMEGVEDIPGSALTEGINWTWERFPEYLDALEAKARVIDVGVQVPHAPVRAYVLGERCNTDYVPTAAEIGEMAELVREGVAAGALGFAASRTLGHKDNKGVFLPGTFAGSDEMLTIGRALKGYDYGVFQLVSDHLGADNDEWAWIKALATEIGLPVTLAATSEQTYAGTRLYDMAEEARQQGLRIRPQIAARPTGVLHGLQSSVHMFVASRTYRREIAGRPLAEQVALMSQPEMRATLLAETDLSRAGFTGVKMSDLLYQIFPLGEEPDYEPKREDSVGARADVAGVPPIELMYDLLVRDGGREFFYQPFIAYAGYNFDFFYKNLPHPNVLFGLSDGGAHCGVIADAGMPTFLLTHWARDRTRGPKLPLEMLVQKLSSDGAKTYGLHDRGELKPGLLADINIIDFDKLTLHRPEAIYDLPAGGRRLVQRVDGYRYIVKSGQVTFKDGEHTGALPGGLVRGGRDGRPPQPVAA